MELSGRFRWLNLNFQSFLITHCHSHLIVMTWNERDSNLKQSKSQRLFKFVKLISDWQHGREEVRRWKKVHVAMTIAILLWLLTGSGCGWHLCQIIGFNFHWLFRFSCCWVSIVSNFRRLQNEIGFQNWLSGFTGSCWVNNKQNIKTRVCGCGNWYWTRAVEIRFNFIY